MILLFRFLFRVVDLHLLLHLGKALERLVFDTASQSQPSQYLSEVTGTASERRPPLEKPSNKSAHHGSCSLDMR